MRRSGVDIGPRRALSVSSIQDTQYALSTNRVRPRMGFIVRTGCRLARRQEAVVNQLLDKGTNPDQQIQHPYVLGLRAFLLEGVRRRGRRA